MASILLHRGRSLNEMDLGLLVEVAELGVTVGMLVEDDAVGDALAVAAERVVDLTGGQQRGELVPEGFLDAGWDRRHETST